MSSIFEYISHNSLFGVIPLDVIAHSVIGYIIVYVLLKKNVNFVVALGVVLLTAIGKELYDAPVMTSSWGESIKDIFFTMSLPTLLALIRLSKRKESY